MSSDTNLHIKNNVLTLLCASFVAMFAVLLLPQLQSTAQAADTAIDGLVCSGGYHNPGVVTTLPANDSTVTQSNTMITLTADWVDTITIKRGATTLATITGSNQSNEILSTTITLNQGVNNLTITSSGGCPESHADTSYKITYVPNSANITHQTTASRSPALFGYYSPLGVRVFVVLAGNTYEAVANPDLTWSLPEGTITPDLDDGSYNLRIYTMDASDNIVFDQTYANALTIDTTAPEVSITTALTLANRSPRIEGTVDDPNATVTVTINGDTYTAVNNRDGTWYISAGTIKALGNGDYEVIVTAQDIAGNQSTLQTTFHIKAKNQSGFVLAPNTGYLRIGQTNIPSSYLYAAGFFLILAFVWVLLSIRNRLTKS